MKLKEAATKLFANPTSKAILSFTLFFYLLEEFLFQPQLHYMAKMAYFPPGQLMINVFTGILSLVAFFLFIFATLVRSRWLKGFYFVLFACAVIVEYGFQRSVHRFMIAADLQMGMRTPLEMWQAAALLFLDWRAILPVLAFLGLLYFYRPPVRFKESVAAAALALLIMGSISLIQGGKVGMVNFGPSLTQFVAALYQYSLVGFLLPDREQVQFVANDLPQNNIILIVDESVSADHLSINEYSRPTTPFLDNLARSHAHLIHNWGIAVAGATCSEPANGLLLTGVPVAEGNLPLFHRYPSLFQYAKAMNYTTYYMDAQTNTLWNGLANTDVIFLDHWITADQLAGSPMTRDFLIADQIYEITTTSTGNFIVINKQGAHYLYEANYPPEAAVWSPTPANPLRYQENLEHVNNAYDNALLYNINTFFERLLPDPERLDQHLQNSFYLYTSDHGQTLYRDQATHSHCGSTHYEAQVPLLLLGNIDHPVDTNYWASHSNILPTLLELMRFPDEERPYDYAISLLRARTADSHERFFFTGVVDTINSYDNLD